MLTERGLEGASPWLLPSFQVPISHQDLPLAELLENQMQEGLGNVVHMAKPWEHRAERER